MTEFLQVVGTLLLGAITALIAYRQWRTARDRFVLELFDRRIAAVEQLNSALLPVLQHADIQSKELGAFDEASQNAKYLFGPDVEEFLDVTRAQLMRVMAYQIRHRHAREGDQLPGAEEFVKPMDALANARVELNRLTLPYIGMDQKPMTFADIVEHCLARVKGAFQTKK